jgi:hypothetical protein
MSLCPSGNTVNAESGVVTPSTVSSATRSLHGSQGADIGDIEKVTNIIARDSSAHGRDAARQSAVTETWRSQ